MPLPRFSKDGLGWIVALSVLGGLGVTGRIIYNSMESRVTASESNLPRIVEASTKVNNLEVRVSRLEDKLDRIEAKLDQLIELAKR